MQELNFEQLLDWIEGRLSDEDAAQVASQVAQADEATRTAMTWLRNFHVLSAHVTLSNPPEGIRTVLRQQFREQTEDRRQPHFFRRILAQLTFDSGWSLATSGVRAASSLGNQRQIVCSTDVADIVLNTQPAKGGSALDVLGQVMVIQDQSVDVGAEGGIEPDHDTGYAVQLLAQDSEVALTRADDMGEFAFEAVPPGIYQVVISSAQFEIQTAAIEFTLA